MLIIELYFSKLRENAILPKKATGGSAGMDLCACMDSVLIIQPGDVFPVPTGLADSIPMGYAGLIYARSGLAVKQGIAPANCVGVIDSDYRGEILVALRNHGNAPFSVEPGMRIAQLVISPVPDVTPHWCESLPDTQRGSGGFGSTGLL